MKNLLIFLLFPLCAILTPSSVGAQNFLLQAFGGFEKSKFEVDNYMPSNGIPFGVRICGGLKHLQIGGEFRRAVHVYTFKDPFVNETRFTESHQGQYLGGLLRFNTSKGENFGFILRLGAGMLRVTKVVELADGQQYESIKLPNAFQLNGGAGFDIPLTTHLHLTIEGDFCRNTRNKADYALLPDSEAPTFKNTVIGGQLGLAVVF
jgi:hypothetical protein